LNKAFLDLQPGNPTVPVHQFISSTGLIEVKPANPSADVCVCVVSTLWSSPPSFTKQCAAFLPTWIHYSGCLNATGCVHWYQTNALQEQDQNRPLHKLRALVVS